MKRLWIVAGVMVAGGAVACISAMLDGVHFNDGQPDFGAPPPPIVLTIWGEDQNRSGNTQNGPVEKFRYDYDAVEKADAAAAEHRAALRKDGLAKEGAGDFNGAIAVYEELIKTGKAEDSESLIDRVEVMREAKAPSPVVMEYLSTRRSLAAAMPDNSGSSEAYQKALEQAKVIEAQSVQSFKAILANPVAGFLKAHASYALASLEFDSHRIREATALYRQAAAAGGPRRERALIMAARCLLWAKDAPEGKTWESSPAPAEAQIAEADAALTAYLKEYPGGHFEESAKGLQGRVLFLRKQNPAALSVYLLQLDRTTDPAAQAAILASIRATVQHLTPSQAKEIQDSMIKNPALLSPYLDYRLYHTGAKTPDYVHLLGFVQKALQANPNARLTGAIYARLAEIELLMHQNKFSQSYAEQSIAAPGTEKKDLAHYVRGSSLKQAGNAAGAIPEYLEVLKTPSSYLANPARENLALLYERGGQWSEALDQYWALGYTFDVAYLLDARMTPQAIQSVIQTRGEKDEHHDLMVYSLGLRYLRMDQFEKARDLFKSISDEKRAALSHKGSRDYAWNSDDKSDTVDLMYDPMETANDLIKLRDAVASASSDAKASAMYDLASYYYSHRNLLLYNAALWDGSRNWMFGASWNAKVADGGDNLAVQAHHYEHEALYRARKICLGIAQTYPKSSFAPKALYRAATAGRRLANFNGWWRDRNKVQDLYEDAAKLMDRVAAEYPTDALAKNARKYAKVFRDEGKGAEQSSMFGR